MPENNVTISTERYTSLLKAECVCGLINDIVSEKVILDCCEVDLIKRMIMKVVESA